MHLRAEKKSNVIKYADFGLICNLPNLIFCANFLVKITIYKTSNMFTTIFVLDIKNKKSVVRIGCSDRGKQFTLNERVQKKIKGIGYKKKQEIMTFY